MKSILALLLAVLLFVSVKAQTPYETIQDPEGKIFKGVITNDLLEKDTVFKWWATNKSPYTPNPAALTALKANVDSVRFLVFMGTWCGDSHYVIPKFYSLLDAAGYPAAKVSLLGTDRNKKTVGNLAESMGVINVPTIIVLKNGKEVGRVVEYGTSGLFDKDLGIILQGMK